VWWHSFTLFDGTEFGGGTLARNNDDGVLLFVLALILAFKFPRAASGSALIACVLSLPLYLYLLFPRPFLNVWPGEWHGNWPRESFVWNQWWASGIIAASLVAFVSAVTLIRSLIARKQARIGV
jgi:hypothetical protein